MNVIEQIKQAKEDINEVLENLIDHLLVNDSNSSRTKKKLTKIKNNFTKKISIPMKDSDKRVIIRLFKKGKNTENG